MQNALYQFHRKNHRSVILIAKEIIFYDVMNDFGHGGPDQDHNEHKAMGRKEFTESYRIIRQGIVYLGFNLRFHNQNCPDSKISIVDVA